MHTPIVSVVMPCYNKAKYITQSITSVMNQSIRDIEIIIIDNCSNDGSDKIIQKLAKDDSRIKFILNKVDKGVVYSLNLGLEMAKGNYIAVLHCDDMWQLNFLESSIEELNKHPQAGLSFCRYANIDESSSLHKITARNLLESKEGYFDKDRLFSLLIGRDFIPVCTALVTREAYDKTGVYDHQFPASCDYDLWLRMPIYFGAIHNPNSTSSYRICTENSTNYLVESNVSMMEQYCLIKKLFSRHLPENPKHKQNEKIMLRNLSLSLLRQAVRYISLGNCQVAQSKCALAMAVYPGFIERAISWALYGLSFLSPLLWPLMSLAISIFVPLFKRLRLY